LKTLTIAAMILASCFGPPSSSSTSPGSRPFTLGIENSFHVSDTPAAYAMQIVLTNNDVTSLPVNPTYFTLQTDAGVVYKPTLVPLDWRAQIERKYGDNTELPLVELRPGQTAKGWLWFTVPASAKIALLIYDDGFGHRFTLRY